MAGFLGEIIPRDYPEPWAAFCRENCPSWKWGSHMLIIGLKKKKNLAFITPPHLPRFRSKSSKPPMFECRWMESAKSLRESAAFTNGPSLWPVFKFRKVTSAFFSHPLIGSSCQNLFQPTWTSKTHPERFGHIRKCYNRHFWWVWRHNWLQRFLLLSCYSINIDHEPRGTMYSPRARLRAVLLHDLESWCFQDCNVIRGWKRGSAAWVLTSHFILEANKSDTNSCKDI